MPNPIPRWPFALLALALGTLLLCYGLALRRGNLLPLLFDGLYGRETAPGDSYQWAAPRLHLFAPLELSAPAVIVSQRLTAGPDLAARRPLTVASAGSTTRFELRGGTPARIYSYLLPIDGHALAADYSIAPLELRGGDQRALGFIVYAAPATTVRPVFVAPAPALPLVAVAFVAPLAALVLSLWGLRRYRLLVACALALAAFAVYARDPEAILIPGLALGRGLLLALLCAAAWRATLRRPSPPSLLLAVSIAAVTAPLIYAANGLWLNLGVQWYGLRPLLLALLLAPPALGLLLAHPRATPFIAWGAALAALCAGAFGAWNLWSELAARPYDFTIYWEAARRLALGQPIYELDRLTLAPFDVYKYHPAFLAFILPLAQLPLELASLLWKGVNLAALAAAGLLFLRAYRPGPPLLGALFVLLLLNLSPVTQSLRLGQIDGLLLLGLALAVALGGRSPWLAGGLWALIGLVKVYPAALALPDLLRLRWRVALAGAMGLGALVLLSGALFGWAQERAFWQEVVPSLGARTTRLSNQSLYGLIGRSLYPGSIDSANRATLLPLASALHALLALPVLALTARAVWRQRGCDRAEARLGAVSALVCAVLLVLPVSWDHYQALLLLPLLAAGAIVLREPAAAPWLLGAYTLLAFGTYKQVQNGLIDSQVVLLLASYRTAGLLLLWGWWLRRQ